VAGCGEWGGAVKVFALSRNGKMAVIGVSVVNGEFSSREMEWFLANLWSEKSWNESSYGRFFLYVPQGALKSGLAGALVVVAEDER
jgi:hypothetical protein